MPFSERLNGYVKSLVFTRNMKINSVSFGHFKIVSNLFIKLHWEGFQIFIHFCQFK